MKKNTTINKVGMGLFLSLATLMGQFSNGGTFEDARKKVSETLKNVSEFDYGLVGSWNAGCHDIELLDIQGIKLGSVQREISFLPTGLVTSTETFFLKASCQEPALEYRLIGVASNFAEKNNSGIHLLDVEVRHQFLKVRNESVVKILNVVNSCGVNNWVVDQEKDIAPLDASMLKAPRTFHDIYDVKSNSLRMGRASHNLTIMNPNDPEQIDPKYVFK